MKNQKIWIILYFYFGEQKVILLFSELQVPEYLYNSSFFILDYSLIIF